MIDNSRTEEFGTKYKKNVSNMLYKEHQMSGKEKKVIPLSLSSQKTWSEFFFIHRICFIYLPVKCFLYGFIPLLIQF